MSAPWVTFASLETHGVDTLEVVAERALAACRGAQLEIGRLRVSETEVRVRLAKAISYARKAIAAYRDSQGRLEEVEADLREAESDLAGAEAARAAERARAEAAEERAAASEAKLAEISLRATQAKERVASADQVPPVDPPDPGARARARARAPRPNGNRRRHSERPPKELEKIEGRLKRIASDARRGARRRAA